jgi:hypothetical protein
VHGVFYVTITMRMVARFFFHHRGHARAIVKCHYTHIKRSPNSRSVFPSGLEDTTKMTAHSRATGLPDLAGEQMHIGACIELSAFGHHFFLA